MTVTDHRVRSHNDGRNGNILDRLPADTLRAPEYRDDRELTVGGARLLLLLFSLCLHGSVAGVLFLFSARERGTEEQVYRVSLAEFAPPRQAVPDLPPAPPESPAESPPTPEPAPPSPSLDSAKEPEPKAISTKKKNAPAKRAEQPRPETPMPVAAPSESAGPRPREVGGYAAFKSDQVDQLPSISRRAAPEYPSKAKRMNVEGRVLVQLVVDDSGMPRACVVQSAEPPGFFEEAALVAAGKTRFTPGKLKGRPVNTLVLLPYAFKLR